MASNNPPNQNNQIDPKKVKADQDTTQQRESYDLKQTKAKKKGTAGENSV